MSKEICSFSCGLGKSSISNDLAPNNGNYHVLWFPVDGSEYPVEEASDRASGSFHYGFLGYYGCND